MGRSQGLYKEAKKIIPGGTQLLSKRPEMFLPGSWPAYYSRAKGCQVWDLDGNRYKDFSFMGIGSCVLGYSDADVDNAAIRAIKRGSMATLNAPEEVELARKLLKLHPWAGMARFARCGGEAMAIAVRIARAHTGKDLVLFCGYHGWHDWYLSANLASAKALDGSLLPGLNPAGVPRGLKGSALPFRYNDTAGLVKLLKKHKNKVAAVIVEAIRSDYPDKGFIRELNRVKRSGAALIVDEITSGFRLNCAGAHLLFGLKPDIAVFAKGMSNGFPMAAIIGRRKVMEAAQGTFISSTYWTERVGPSAALASINKMISKDVPAHLSKAGKLVQDGWRRLAEKHGLKIKVSGIYPLGHFSFSYSKPLVYKTLFTRLMLERGFLASTAFYASYAHKDKDIKLYLSAVDSAFRVMARAAKEGRPDKYLKGEACHSGFKRLA